MDDVACRQAAKWLTESGYALEMRVAAVCRKHFLNAAQSVPYQDPIQPETTREADVMVRFGNKLDRGGVRWTLTSVIECKFPKKHPWAAILGQTGFDGTLSRSALVSSRLTSLMAENVQDRLTYAWGGWAPFASAPLADSLVTVNNNHNDASSALRQAMSAAEGIHRQFVTQAQAQAQRHLMITLPILVIQGELLGAELSPSGDIEVENLPHVFVETPRPGGSGTAQVHVMTVDYFAETFAPELLSVRQAIIY